MRNNIAIPTTKISKPTCKMRREKIDGSKNNIEEVATRDPTITTGNPRGIFSLVFSCILFSSCLLVLSSLVLSSLLLSSLVLSCLFSCLVFSFAIRKNENEMTSFQKNHRIGFCEFQNTKFGKLLLFVFFLFSFNRRRIVSLKSWPKRN